MLYSLNEFRSITMALDVMSERARVLRKRSEVLIIVLVGKDLAPKWWDSENRAFGMTPNKKWVEDPEAVYGYLMSHSDGQW